MRKFLVSAVICGSFLLALACFSPGHAQAADFAGAEACRSCHEDYYKSYTKSIHGKKYVPGSPARGEDCEACHGPGAAHAEKGGGKGSIIAFSKNMNVKEKSAKCLACHQDSKDLAFWGMSKHKTSGFSCDSCHSVHKGATPLQPTAGYLNKPVQGKALKLPTPDLCFGCHKDVRSQTMRQSHHPIREGKLLCGSCHVPHGGFGPKMVKADSINELCFKCHAEKRGPFMMEHPPVAENCLNCHVAHGSNHYALLVSKTPQLCQSCHDAAFHPGQPYTNFETFKGQSPSNRMVSRNCVLCHTQVHGGNSLTDRGQRFLR